MRWLGTRTVDFCDIRVPGDWDERIAAARNGEFAAMSAPEVCACDEADMYRAVLVRVEAWMAVNAGAADVYKAVREALALRERREWSRPSGEP